MGRFSGRAAVLGADGTIPVADTTRVLSAGPMTDGWLAVVAPPATGRGAGATPEGAAAVLVRLDADGAVTGERALPDAPYAASFYDVGAPVAVGGDWWVSAFAGAVRLAGEDG
ncbi:hypothetical protein GIS00_12660 [Nakamurella sp. YIM 132087]|uniref:Uncharacterized protein n=1 Tax=Nakamurella alba TaxID=2665158 RepID=A0A7K1FKW8_9ACTN|nr:hypothetical protein [Nakamurella alba]MTD14792.1 hypothetical protein [Nakamurella alba]